MCLDHLFEFSCMALISGAGDFVALLNVTSDEKVLPTTYGQLKPPLGSHRLKVRFHCENLVIQLEDGLVIRWIWYQILELHMYSCVCFLYNIFFSDFICVPDGLS